MTKPTTSALLRRPEDGQRVKGPVAQLTYQARGVETAGAMTVIQTLAAPGEGPPLHVHANDHEFICVMEGRLRVKFGESIHNAPAGSFLFIPKGLTHTWQNPGPETARFLFGFTPASVGMEQFFERSDRLTGDRRLDDAFSKFATDAGMKVVGPPLAESDPDKAGHETQPTQGRLDGPGATGRRRGD
jgi:quercetin dioxygenase-like cupin family protein